MSLAGDIFQGLVKGLKFDKKKNAAAFTAQRQARKSSKSNAAGVQHDASLDFFGDRTTEKRKRVKQPTLERSKKRQRSTAQSEQNGSESDSDEEANPMSRGAAAVRKQLRIKVKGTSVPPPSTTFNKNDLLAGSTSDRKAHLVDLVLDNIEKSQYKEPTPIQMQSIPALVAGRDIIGCAPTGSGKTAAFLIPLIVQLASKESDRKNKSKPKAGGQIRSLVVAPTRELATQIYREFEKLTEGKHFRACVLQASIVSALRESAEKSTSQEGFDLIVSTPLRLVSLIKSKAIDLGGVEYVVLDEADKLFEMGFLDQVDEIFAACGDQSQRCLFSATMPPQIEELAKTVLRDPVEVVVGTLNAGAATIDQKLLFVGQENGKMVALRQLIAEGELVPPTLIFVQSKERAKDLLKEMVYEGLKIDAIHAERTQLQRDETIRKFRLGEIWFLICTDLMGRGIDFKGVNCVINYDFPLSSISYVHRIGRTGRANHHGKAITMFTLDDVDQLRSIANVVRISGCEVPDWMLALRKQTSKEKKRAMTQPKKRAEISTSKQYNRTLRDRKRGSNGPGKSNSKSRSKRKQAAKGGNRGTSNKSKKPRDSN